MAVRRSARLRSVSAQPSPAPEVSVPWQRPLFDTYKTSSYAKWSQTEPY